MSIVNFGASEWRRVKIFTNTATIRSGILAFRKYYGVSYSEHDIILLLRRFQFESRLALSFPEVKSLMFKWLGFEFKLSYARSKKAIHAANFYNFIPLKIEHF